MASKFGRTLTNMALGAMGMRKRPKSVKGFALSMLMHAPSTIAAIQSLANTLNWKKAQQSIRQDVETTIVIAGQSGAGKHTLVNFFLGMSGIEFNKHDTDSTFEQAIAPFQIVEASSTIQEHTLHTLRKANLILYVIDGTKEISEDEKLFLKQLQKLRVPLVLVINKIDLLPRLRDEVVAHIQKETHTKLTVEISALTGEHILDALAPTMVTLSPTAAMAIGRALPSYRKIMAKRLIRSATLISTMAAMEPIPFIDIPILLGIQTRLVFRLAAVYGYPMDTISSKKYRSVIVTTVGTGLFLRYVGEEIAKTVPIAGDIVAGILAGAGTWSIGQAAKLYLEKVPQLITPGHTQLLPADYGTTDEREH